MRFLACIAAVMMAACAPITQTASAQTPPPIIVDQFGYLPALNKVAVIKDPKLGLKLMRRRVIGFGTLISHRCARRDDMSFAI